MAHEKWDGTRAGAKKRRDGIAEGLAASRRIEDAAAKARANTAWTKKGRSKLKVKFRERQQGLA